jgi:hypothetical protein
MQSQNAGNASQTLTATRGDVSDTNTRKYIAIIHRDVADMLIITKRWWKPPIVRGKREEKPHSAKAPGAWRHATA